jgi:hypothetical protein
MLAISSWPCEQESGFGVFRFDREVRVETLERLKLGIHFRVSSLQGSGQDREERTRAM